MYRSHVLSLLLLFLFFSCTEEHKKIPATGIAENQEITSYLDTLTFELDQIGTTSIIPGFAVAILNDKEVLYKKGFGYSNLKDSIPFTPTTVNFIASIAKTFIGVSIMKLIEMGKLNLDEKVNDILPYEIFNPHFPDVPITVRHLVTHTAGLVDDFDPEEVGEADIVLLEELTYENDTLEAIIEQDLAYYRLGKYITLGESLEKYLSPNGKWYSETNFRDYPPGTKYEYSNLGADLAARIVEIKTEMTFNEFTDQYIFQPLQMNNTGWFYEDIDSTLSSKIYRPDDWDDPQVAIEHPKYLYVGYTSGDLKSNIEDMTKYLVEMIKGYHGGGKLLQTTSYQTLFEPQLDSSYFDEPRDEFPLNDEYNVGIFWAVSASGIRLHNGGSIGVYSFLYFNPEKKSGAVGFSNLPDASFGQVRDAVYKYEQKIFSPVSKN